MINEEILLLNSIERDERGEKVTKSKKVRKIQQIFLNYGINDQPKVCIK